MDIVHSVKNKLLVDDSKGLQCEISNNIIKKSYNTTILSLKVSYAPRIIKIGIRKSFKMHKLRKE